MSSQFNNLIKSKSINTLTPQQILAAGESIFLDVQTSPDLASINKAIPAFANIHSPTFGTPIPLSGEVSTCDGSETLLAPSNHEVREIIAINGENTGGAPIVFDITLGGMIVSLGNLAGPTATGIAVIPSRLYASKNLPLAVVVTSGTAAELTTSCASILISQ